ncbi:MAG: hypothetical protein U0T73_12595 [Chitinophagales bacterium]
MTPRKNSLLWSILACSISALTIFYSPFLLNGFAIHWPADTLLFPVVFSRYLITVTQLGLVFFSVYVMFPSLNSSQYDDSFTQAISLLGLLTLVAQNFFENAMPFGTGICIIGITILAFYLFKKSLAIKTSTNFTYATLPFSLLAGTSVSMLSLALLNIPPYYNWVEDQAILQSIGLVLVSVLSLSGVIISSHYREPLYSGAISWFLMGSALHETTLHPSLAMAYTASSVVLFGWSMHLVNKKNYYRHFENLFQHNQITIS